MVSCVKIDLSGDSCFDESFNEHMVSGLHDVHHGLNLALVNMRE